MSENQKKVAIVTGSSRGIGREIALRLASDGFAIAVNYAGNRESAETVVAEISEGGGHAVAIGADVSKTADVTSLFDQTEKAFGRIDGLVNNAGVMVTRNLVDLNDDEFDRMFSINVRGVFLTLREASRRMKAGGRIVNLSTSSTPLRLPGYAAYCATKSAVEAFTAILAKELRGREITVNAIAPGPVGTDLFLEGKSPELIDRLAKLNPFERLGETSDIAAVVSFLLGPGAGWINGQTIRVNGGMV